VMILFLAVYLLAWYLPFKGTYDYMMAHQSGTLEINREVFNHINFNITYFLLSKINLPFTLTFLVCLLTGIFLLFRKVSGSFPLLFKTALLWLILESHKLTMVYWPTRYQVSMYVAMGLLITIVFYELINNGGLFKNNRRATWLLRVVAVTWIMVMFVNNVNDYFKTLERREWVIRDTNRYLAENLTKDDVAIGAWAPSLTWDAKCRAFPVWGGFLNDQDPLVKFHPKVVLSEPDEQDSEQAYKKQGIDLLKESDSIRSFQIGQWNIKVYWIR